ncbi:uncharacterized protein LOC143920313 [Arctopsyche grandis]|uniref:uncharacterized protein LOC143920313 n=1 Tax=Arctopsyche grandis TaxID=121162 RepID=UPI00406D9222
MSLLQTLPYSLYNNLVKRKDWIQKVTTVKKIRDANAKNGEELINYFDKKGYTLSQFYKLLKDCDISLTETNSQSGALANQSRPILKIAILVANARYDNWSHLVTPISDCKILADILKSMGFIIFLLTNVNSKQFRESMTELCTIIPTKSYVLFYFAGHGFELCGTKYMLGVESPSEKYTIDNGVSENFILKNGFLNKPDLFILLLDMCRKQPDRVSNPDIYLNIPRMEEYKHTCNLIIGYATSPYMPSFEKLCCESANSLSQVQHDTCEINHMTKSDNLESFNEEESSSESDGIGDQVTHKLTSEKKLNGVSLYVNHLSKYLNKNEDFIRILELVHKEFANEQCEQALLQKPQKLDNVAGQFYLHLKAKGHKETEEKLHSIVNELHNQGINIAIK